MMNPCETCDYRTRCDYSGEEDRCPIVRRERDPGHPLHDDERDDEAMEAVQMVILGDEMRLVGQMALL